MEKLFDKYKAELKLSIVVYTLLSIVFLILPSMVDNAGTFYQDSDTGRITFYLNYMESPNSVDY